MDIIRAIPGVALLFLTAYIFSSKRGWINWKTVISGFILHLLIGIAILYIPGIREAFNALSYAFVRVLSFSDEGARFLFGDLVDNEQLGFIFAFKVLPTLIFFATLSAGLYYLGILQKLVFAMAWVMTRLMNLSGAESLSAAGNVFLGQTEAPLLVRPYIKGMTPSELMCLMTGGMATIAGGVLAGYVAFLGGDSIESQTQFASYLLTASFMNAPAAIVMSKMLLPEKPSHIPDVSLSMDDEKFGDNFIDAIARGAADGVRLALNVGAMLLAFISLIALLNAVLRVGIGRWTGLNDIIAQSTGGTFDFLSFEYLIGQVFRVFTFAMGVPWSETLAVGSLLGQKTVINEFVAYISLADFKDEGVLSPKAIVISTYALCGFSNFSSIAIQIGGIGGIAPSQSKNLSRLGMRALLAATLACMMSGTIAGAITPGL